jgi:ribosome production factor 2
LNFWSAKNDASLFVVGTHTKKRPHGLVWVRCFSGEVMEMLEVGIEEVMAMSNFKVRFLLPRSHPYTLRPSPSLLAPFVHPFSFFSISPFLLFQSIKSTVGGLPLFHFSAVEPHTTLWDTHPTFTQFKSLMLDFFRGTEMDGVSLKGLERVISITIGGSSAAEEAQRESAEAVANGAQNRAVQSLIGGMNLGGAGGDFDEDKSLPVVHFRTYTYVLLQRLSSLDPLTLSPPLLSPSETASSSCVPVFPNPVSNSSPTVPISPSRCEGARRRVPTCGSRR